MIKEIKDGIRSLVPPANGEDPRPWRINVFVTLLVLIAVLAFHLASVNGYLSGLGIPAVAKADELEKVTEGNHAILKAIYSPQIRAKIRARCDTSDADTRERINKELDRLLNEYKLGAGKDFTPMPTCTEV